MKAHDKPHYGINWLKQKATKDAILRAYKSLDKEEQIKLINCFKPFEKYNCMSRMNKESRLELIGKVGMWLAKNKKLYNNDGGKL